MDVSEIVVSQKPCDVLTQVVVLSRKIFLVFLQPLLLQMKKGSQNMPRRIAITLLPDFIDRRMTMPNDNLRHESCFIWEGQYRWSRMIIMYNVNVRTLANKYMEIVSYSIIKRLIE